MRTYKTTLRTSFITAKIFIIALILCVPLSLYAGSQSTTTGEDVKKETKEAVETVMNYSADQKDQALTNAQKMLDDFDAKMKGWEDKMKSKWGDTKSAAKDSYTNTQEGMMKKRQELSQWYDKMKDSSADAWGEMQQGFSDSYNELSDSFDKAQKEFKN